MRMEYDLYLTGHVGNVQKGWDWMREHLLPEIDQWIQVQYPDNPIIDIYGIQSLLSGHDLSKYDREEYNAYDAYFYGPPATRKSSKTVQEFNAAFLRHIHKNPHHWQYWVLIHDDPDEPETLIEIPLNYIFEMICDWWSFSWRTGDLMAIFSWWNEHKDYIRMHKKSRKVVEYILKEMKDILMEDKLEEDSEKISYSDDHLEHHGIQGQKWGERNGPPYPLNGNGKIRQSRKHLNSYASEPITSQSINAYKSQAKQLSHVRINKFTNGRIFTDNGKLTAMVNVETKNDGHNWIQGLEVFDHGKGQGLSYGLLDYAVTELDATHLSVNKTNTIAKHVYDEYGFKTYDESPDMYFMEIKK